MTSKGAIFAFGRGIGLVSGESTDFHEDDAQFIDDVLFAFVLLFWSVASFGFAARWYHNETNVKPRFSDPKTGLWIDFTPVEELNEFAPNKITKSGQDFYRSLPKNVQGDWLKFIKYGRAPKVLHLDCRASEGSISLFTFDGIVKREPKKIKVRSIKHFLSRVRLVPDLLVRVEKLFRLTTLSEIVKQLFRDVPPGLDDIYNSSFVDPGSEAESGMKETVQHMLQKIKPDVFVATLPKEPNLPADLQNKTKTVERFFRRLNLKVEYVSNEEQGRYEALAVAYAHSRQLSETPGVVINVGERWMRVTMTRS